jgi:hypothetical protein
MHFKYAYLLFSAPACDSVPHASTAYGRSGRDETAAFRKSAQHLQQLECEALRSRSATYGRSERGLVDPSGADVITPAYPAAEAERRGVKLSQII